MTQLAQSKVVASKMRNQPILRASSVTKTYEMGDTSIQVLKDVSLTVQIGEFVAIEGRSGSGKSTLLHILSGLDAADTGRVESDGQDISELARKAAIAYKRGRWMDRMH